MDNELREHLERLETAINELSSKKKDFWDRASIVTTFLSGVVIAGLVAWWTYAAGQAELHINKLEIDQAAVMGKYDLQLKRLQQRTDDLDKTERRRIYSLEVIERFVPYVADGSKRRKVALVALSELGQTELATKFSQLYADEDTTAAVDQIQSQAISDKQKVVPEPVKAGTLAPGDSTSKGWVYLGHFDGSVWKTRYLDFPPSYKPGDLQNRSFKVRDETGALNVRSGPPGLLGRTKSIIAVLAQGSTVLLKGSPELTLSGYVWHQVEFSN
ncbi:MAG: hypothetical protein GY706_13490 [Bacteroides sp.]|nr:hypothetical protein [Bacteroides sp.]